MAQYLAQRIMDGALQYTVVVSKKPQYKSDIDVYLSEHGRADLIVEA